jgi:Flp pilus assembly protein protease CpaA
MSQSAVYSLCFVVILTGVAAFQDLRTGLITNRIVLAGVIVGLTVSWTSAAVSGGVAGWSHSYQCFSVLFGDPVVERATGRNLVSDGDG